VIRSHRVKVMDNRGPMRRAHELLVSGGDAWCWAVDRSNRIFREGLPPANGASEMWADLKAHGPFGDLTTDSAQDVTRSWATAWFETAKKRKGGEAASYPTHKHYRMPVTWRRGRFSLSPPAPGRRARVTLTTRRGVPNLTLKLSHFHPYDPEQVRCVRLTEEAGDLFLVVTAWVGVEQAQVDPEKVGGADPGIIHPWAVSSGEDALLISGRAIRAEEALHLSDSKGRQKKASRCRQPVRARHGKPRQEGSRRQRRYARAQREREARSRRKIRQELNRAANEVKSFLVETGTGTLAIGNPSGVEKKNSGRVQNRRTGRWMQAPAAAVVTWRCEEAGVHSEKVNERGTSSTCPLCGSPATKRGRKLTCRNPLCGASHHRDIAGSQNISTRLGATPTEVISVMHRRIGQPKRRDRRRQLWDLYRTQSTEVLPVSGPPGSRSPRRGLAESH